MNREDHRITLVRGKHFNARLPARLLLTEHEFAALEIPAALTQEEGDLKRKDDIAVQILVQTIEIAGAVFQEQRGWALLPRAVTLFDEVGELFRKAGLVAPKPMAPFVRKRREPRINGRPELLHERRERIIEVFVLALTEGIAGHFDPSAKLTVVGISGS